MIRYSTKSPNHNRWYLPMLVSLALIFGIMIGLLVKDLSPGSMIVRYEGESSFGTGEIDEILQIIDSRYYETVDIDTLKEAALNAIFEKLDPYSQYITTAQNQELNGQMNGQFDGIGIEYSIIDGKIAILRVLPDGPADEADLRKGDFIVGVDSHLPGADSAGVEKIINLLKGPKGEIVQVHIDRYGSDQVIKVDIERKEIKIETIGAAFMMNDSVAYINLKRFNSNTYKSFMEEIERLVENEGMKDLVLDLRGNPGGYLQEAVNILSQLFKEKGKLLVYTKGNKQKKIEYTSTGKSFFPIRKVAVLVDEASASASEILAGAIQDLDRGILIGSPTYGKGLVQEHFNLKNGSGIRLTIANYYTPSGRSIQRSFGEGLLVNNIDSTVVYKTSRGRTVFGGQGIVPDIDINDYLGSTEAVNPEYYEAASEYCFEFMRKNFEESIELKEVLKSRNSAEFQRFIEGFRSFYSSKGLGEDYPVLPQKIITFLQERILYLLMEESEYYKWLVSTEIASKLALENLNNPVLLKASVE